MARSYIFESSKPASVRKREAAERAAKRRQAAKKAAQTRKAGTAAPRSLDRQIKDKIRYINRRIGQYGDPDHMIDLLPEELRTDTGRIASTPEAVQFFAQRPTWLQQISAQIRKHPVSTSVRDEFERILGDIYDEMQNIGSEQFYKIAGKDFASAMQQDSDSNAKMQDIIGKWRTVQEQIPRYYEEQVRTGKLVPYSD